MGFVLYLQHSSSENSEAVTGNASTGYRPKEERCGEETRPKQPALALQTASTANVVFIVLPRWQRGISHQEGGILPSVPAPGLFIGFPPSCASAH